MAAPKFTPLDPTDRPRTYSSPEHVPSPWRNDKPAAIVNRQPKGQKLGHQGPDQGYALKLAEGLRDSIVLQPGESADDAIRLGTIKKVLAGGGAGHCTLPSVMSLDLLRRDHHKNL